MYRNRSKHATGKRIVRFAFTGVLATILHASIAVFIIEKVVPTPPLANGVAFAIATALSYLLNTTWSFSRPLRGKNLFRFFLVSSVGLLLAMSISMVAEFLGIRYYYGIVMIIFIVPPLTFFLHNCWTYR